MERTKDLLKMIESTKVHAVGIHCRLSFINFRFVNERPRQQAHWDVLAELARSIKIPVIANGDFWTLDDIQSFKLANVNIQTADESETQSTTLETSVPKEESNPQISNKENDSSIPEDKCSNDELTIYNGTCGSEEEYGIRDDKNQTVSSFMFARGAQENVSLFRKEGLLPGRQVMQEYLQLSILNGMKYHNAKYTLMQMGYPEEERVAFRQTMVRAKTMKELCDLLDLTDFYSTVVAEHGPLEE